MYTYALIDPKDEPYVTFKYTMRSERASTETIHELAGYSPSLQSGSATSPPQGLTKPKGPRRKLSVPPRRKLVPSSTLAEPMSPVKQAAVLNDGLASTGSESGGTKIRRDWMNRTPSPMVSRLFERPATPLSGLRKVGSAGLLRNVVVNKLKKREEKDKVGAWPT